MRVCAVICLALFLFFSSQLCAVTVILKSGKKITGDLISEDQSVIRLRANDGTVYSLNMVHIDRIATAEANQKEDESAAADVEPKKEEVISSRPSSLAEAAADARQNRTGAARVYTEADLIAAPDLALVSTPNSDSRTVIVPLNVKLPEKEKDLAEWIREKEKEFNKLKAQCRAAGADDSKKEYKTDTYIVNGSPVSVSGYWADPKEVQKAKQICRNAMETEAALIHARAKLTAK